MSQGCINVTNEWEGESKSIKIYSNKCVNIYSQFGCSNFVENLHLDHSNQDCQANFPFKWGIKSINLCSNNNNINNNESSINTVVPNRLRQIVTFTVLGILGFGFLVALLVIIYLRRRVRTVLSEKEIHDFQNGIHDFEMTEMKITAENQPYDPKYEIPKEDIVISNFFKEKI